ncbi:MULTISPECIES: hypothetical protein [Methylosinus]|uniref:hypothetical protein n=1 Tax=Methylosinus TaxID=425 RepID=UPI00047573AE|nr:hypothetical protein [Methylosinus sp. LW4]
MKPADYELVYDKARPLSNTTTLTVAEVPDRMEDLLHLLSEAMIEGRDNHSRLTEIHLPMSRFPQMDSKFWHIPVEDCGEHPVLRLFFETQSDFTH